MRQLKKSYSRSRRCFLTWPFEAINMIRSSFNGRLGSSLRKQSPLGCTNDGERSWVFPKAVAAADAEVFVDRLCRQSRAGERNRWTLAGRTFRSPQCVDCCLAGRHELSLGDSICCRCVACSTHHCLRSFRMWRCRSGFGEPHSWPERPLAATCPQRSRQTLGAAECAQEDYSLKSLVRVKRHRAGAERFPNEHCARRVVAPAENQHSWMDLRHRQWPLTRFAHFHLAAGRGVTAIRGYPQELCESVAARPTSTHVPLYFRDHLYRLGKETQCPTQYRRAQLLCRLCLNLLETPSSFATQKAS